MGPLQEIRLESLKHARLIVVRYLFVRNFDLAMELEQRVDYL